MYIDRSICPELAPSRQPSSGLLAVPWAIVCHTMLEYSSPCHNIL